MEISVAITARGGLRSVLPPTNPRIEHVSQFGTDATVRWYGGARDCDAQPAKEPVSSRVRVMFERSGRVVTHLEAHRRHSELEFVADTLSKLTTCRFTLQLGGSQNYRVGDLTASRTSRQPRDRGSPRR